MHEHSPIIIFGAPRSGTTYLHQILNKHPDVYVSHETRVFAWLHQSLNVLTRRDDFLFTRRENFIEHLRTAYPDLIRNFYRAQFPGKKYWGDKNPHYADPKNLGCLNTIAEIFPGTRFIHIIRDGRDVVSSLIRKRNAEGKPWVEWEPAHRVWTNHISIGCNFGKTMPPEQYFEVRYEDLIADDVRYARRIFEFLGIPLHPAVIEFSESQQRERTPFSGPTRNLASGVTLSDWAALMEPSDQIRSLEILAPELIRRGYETESSLEEARQSLKSLVNGGTS
jgi:hypothetical protein